MASDPVVSEAPAGKESGESVADVKSTETKHADSNETKAAAPKKAVATDANPSDAVSSITSVGDASSSKSSEVEQETATVNGVYYPPNNYVGVYYPGYEVVPNEWEDPNAYMGQIDGLEISYQGIQADNGLVYYVPGYAYPPSTYNPYNPYVPGAVYDGLLAHQPYYGAPIFQQPIASPAYFQPPVAYGSEIPPAFSWDSGAAVERPTNVVPIASRTGNVLTSPTQQPFVKVAQTGKKQSPVSESKVPHQVSEGVPFATQIPTAGETNASVPQVQSLKPASPLPKAYVSLGNVLPPLNQGKPSTLASSPNDVKSNGHEWIGSDRLRLRGKLNENGNSDSLNEQNRGPRINKMRGPWASPASSENADPSEPEHTENSAIVVNRDLYNLPDFPTKYDNALFFVIKSYSEDDVHKSIKYSVWASTPNGNKRLDYAFHAAQEKCGGKAGSCPIFLFFSVNASGQFCGVAEMVGPVDFTRSMTFWQQDKWNGFFPVKWHIIKDVPNIHFRHIILENNDNKPVTNSRDTQEIPFHKGIEMLSIFKNHSARTSILDDFEFYEQRQKAMQDKKRQLNQDHFQLGAMVEAVHSLALNGHSNKSDLSARGSNVSDPKGGNSNRLSDSKVSALEQVPPGRKEQNISVKVVETKNGMKTSTFESNKRD
eukprot:TRINITY_DN762_c1_g1_i1.p1 TRINITY_DN762_c1_g1~~TRINITY_DN762_c1_g1_i1.p1  ORF type:complete len:656 (-),score=102.90 TRINITY_DN762_c1_g1_i1:961-2928(-)